MSLTIRNMYRDVIVRKSLVVVAPGAMTVAAEPIRIVMPEAGVYVGTVASAVTAPVGSDAIFDVNKNGTTLYTTQASRPTIADGDNESAEAATADVTSLAEGDVITFDCDQIGSGTAGSDVTYTFTYLARCAVR